jgi:ABC-2 type transport system permease protein
MEVLVSSVSPFQLMLGKVLGFGAAAFTQVFIWVLMGAIMALASGSMALDINPIITRIVFNPVIAVFFVLLFVSGYVLYSTLFALLGSIVNSDKEAQSFIFLIVMPLMMPVLVGSSIAQDPNVGWATIMSFIPFFTPTMMMMRVMFIAPTMTEISFTSGIIPEATLAVLLTCLMTVGVVWITGKVFRVGILMYGKRPTLPELIKWIKY